MVSSHVFGSTNQFLLLLLLMMEVTTEKEPLNICFKIEMHICIIDVAVQYAVTSIVSKKSTFLFDF